MKNTIGTISVKFDKKVTIVDTMKQRIAELRKDMAEKQMILAMYIRNEIDDDQLEKALARSKR